MRNIYFYYFKMATIVLRERRSCVHDEWNRYFVTVYQVMMATAKTSEVMISILQFGTLGLSLLWTVTLHEGNSDRKYKLWNVISTERYLGLWFVMFQNRTLSLLCFGGFILYLFLMMLFNELLSAKYVFLLRGLLKITKPLNHGLLMEELKWVSR